MFKQRLLTFAFCFVLAAMLVAPVGASPTDAVTGNDENLILAKKKLWI